MDLRKDLIKHIESMNLDIPTSKVLSSIDFPRTDPFLQLGTIPQSGAVVLHCELPNGSIISRTAQYPAMDEELQQEFVKRFLLCHFKNQKKFPLEKVKISSSPLGPYYKPEYGFVYESPYAVTVADGDKIEQVCLVNNGETKESYGSPKWADYICNLGDLHLNPSNAHMEGWSSLQRHPESYWGSNLYYDPSYNYMILVRMPGAWGWVWMDLESFKLRAPSEHIEEYNMVQSLME